MDIKSPSNSIEIIELDNDKPPVSDHIFIDETIMTDQSSSPQPKTNCNSSYSNESDISMDVLDQNVSIIDDTTTIIEDDSNDTSSPLINPTKSSKSSEQQTDEMEKGKNNNKDSIFSKYLKIIF
jgi:hypothetical protein